MNKFQYKILRYRPDGFSGEFINLGIVVMQQPNLHFRFCDNDKRLHHFFPTVNSEFVLETVRKIEEGLQVLKARLQNQQLIDLETVTRQVLPRDDSSLYFSETKLSLDGDGQTLAEELFERLVMRHVLDKCNSSPVLFD